MFLIVDNLLKHINVEITFIVINYYLFFLLFISQNGNCEICIYMIFFVDFIGLAAVNHHWTLLYFVI